MKSSKRVPTHQTNKSKKKVQKTQQYSSQLQLPKITKSSNYDTNSNISYDIDMDYQKDGTDQLDKIQQNQKQQHGLINYQKMTMQDIKNQYQRLRQEVNTLTSQIKKRQELFQSKIMKKQSRIYSSQQKQKQISQLQQQIYQNNYLLNKLRQQCQHTQKRSNLANSSISKPNADLNDKVIDVKSKILNIKQKIKLLRRKTKKGGEDIVNGQDIHQVLQKLQRQQKAFLSKQSNLQSKLQQSAYKLQRQQQKISQIEFVFSQAEDYLKLFKLENQEVIQKNNLLHQLKQRQHKQEIIKKKIQSDQQVYLQKYHQLLKAFELQTQKMQKIDKKLINEDVKILKNQNIILDLEQELQQLENILQRLNEQNQLKKQAQQLKQLMLGDNNYPESTFMTGYGFSSTNTNLITHLHGVRSIIEENESQVRDTIQGNQSKEILQNETKIKSQRKLLFKKVQDKQIQITKARVLQNLTAKSIDDRSYLRQQKYFTSSKQISNQRDQIRSKGNLTSIRKNGSIANTNPVRKATSVVKTAKQPSKLKQLSMNRTQNNEISRKLSKIETQKGATQPLVTKQPYLNFNKNPHKIQVQKGKQALRQRKGSLKIISQEDKPKEVIKKNLLEELQYIKKQLNNQVNCQTDNNNKDVHQFQNLNAEAQQNNLLNQLNTNEGMLKTDSKKSANKIQVSSQQRNIVQGKIVKPGSKQGTIRSQKSIIKPQMLQQIDKRNMDYSKKIQQLKKQIESGQSVSLKQINKSLNYEQQQTLEDKLKKQQPKQVSNQSQENEKISLDQKNKTQNNQIVTEQREIKIEEQKIEESNNQFNDNNLKQDIKNTNSNLKPQSQSQIQSQDEDIQNDISEINKMIKMKLQNPIGMEKVI